MPHRRLLCAVALVVAALAAAPAAGAAQPSYLFAMSADGGSLKRDASGWWVTLTGTSPLVTRFSDRPQRLAATMTPTAFARAWRGYGFAADPPNAALVIAGASAEADVFVIELRRPRVVGTRVTFRARPIRSAASALERYQARGDRPRELAFGPASLFIDDGAGTVFTPLEFQIENVVPGQTVSIAIGAYDGIPVGFSSGPALQFASGVQLSSPAGPVPLSSMSIGGNRILIQTPPGVSAGTIQLTLTLFVAASEDIQAFTLQSLSDPGILVTAAVGGGTQAQVVANSPTLFAWN
jgi:hypothetical protein